jgi:pyruvate/2-oxoglutarate dehydrogenase complex dihydrolipoamide dehydrogenase (E3) component
LLAVALMEAMALTRTIFGDERTAPDHTNVATAVFSHPQIGTVGMSEEQVGLERGCGCAVALVVRLASMPGGEHICMLVYCLCNAGAWSVI